MEAIKVTLEPVNARSDLHMLLCSDFIFNRWLDIMEKYIIGEIANNKGEHSTMNSNELAKGKKMQVDGTTQLSPSIFRCIQGLLDDEVLKIQEMIFRGTILLKKAKSITEYKDMEDIATSFKYNRALKNGIVEYLKSISGEEKLDYDEVAKKYNITKEIYDKMYKWSKDWMKEAINKAKKKAPLPELVKNELRLAHAKAFGVQQRLNFEMPWKIFNTGELMSCFTDVIAACGDSNDIGLVLIDTTSQGTEYEWTTDAFKRLLECIASIILGDSYVLVAVLSYGPVLSALDTTLRHIVGSVHLEYGSYTKGDACRKKYTSSHDLCVLTAFISKTEDKTTWDGLIGNELPSIVYDENESDDEEEPEEEPNSEAMSSSKIKLGLFEKPISYESCALSGGCTSKYSKDRAFFYKLVSSLCPHGKCVVDAFTGGFAMREALRSERKAIVFVSKSTEKDLLESYASMMVECLPEVNAFYKSLGGKMGSASQSVSLGQSNPLPPPREAQPLPMDFLRDIAESSKDINLLNMQEGYVGLDDVIEDANANTMIENEDHVEIDGMGTMVIQEGYDDNRDPNENNMVQNAEHVEMDGMESMEKQAKEKDMVQQASY